MTTSTNRLMNQRWQIWSALLSMAIATGCTRSEKNIEAPKTGSQGVSSQQNQSQSPNQQQNVITNGVTGGTQASIGLDARAITEKTSIVNRAAVRFKFEYGTYKSENTIDMTGDRAEIKLERLPVGISELAKLELYDGDKLKARGDTKTPVTLTATGPNLINIVLTLENSGTQNPGTTNAIISVTLPGTQPPVNPPIVTPSNQPVPIVSPSNQPVPIVSVSPEPDQTSWDGRSDRGNDKWKIETVSQ